MLCIILGLADAYVLSEGSTFAWDACAPHAILRAPGRGAWWPWRGPCGRGERVTPGPPPPSWSITARRRGRRGPSVGQTGAASWPTRTPSTWRLCWPRWPPCRGS
ncbi:unnamed protein product, partial [Bubo scandiacus]